MKRLIVTLFALWHVAAAGAPTAADGDRDADGVLDALDNCLIVANTDQADSDRDGFGNLCDPDVNNDGLVDAADEELLRIAIGSAIDAAPSADRVVLLRTLDLNGDGVIDGADLAILLDYVGLHPGPVLDSDGDGLGDAADRCAGTLAATAAVLPGCSALDIVRKPTAILGRPRLTLRKLIGAAAADPALSEAAGEMGRADARLAGAIEAVASGDACGSAALLGEAAAILARAGGAVDGRRADLRADLAPGGLFEDVTAAETAIFPLDLLAREIERSHTEVVDLRHGLSAICGSSTPFRTTGTIERVRDGERQVEVGGLTLALSPDLVVSGAMGPGVRGTVEGIGFGDGTGILVAATFDDGPPVITGDFCYQLRFVPVQRMAPIFHGPYVIHSPGGYRLGESYMFERGMRFAVEDLCARPPASGPVAATDSYRRYSMSVTAYFTRSDGLPGTRVIAYDLQPNETPVALPDNLDPDEPVTILARLRVQECALRTGRLVLVGEDDPPQNCGPATYLTAEYYDLLVRERGERCAVAYATRELAIDDQVPSAWGQTWVTGVVPVAVWDTGTEPLFTAEGHPLCPLVGDLLHPCPTVQTIYENHSFALKNVDFYPIHDPGGTDWIEEVTGVDHASGLRWPKVGGVNGGLPWQFSCTLPRVVRDIVNFCHGGTNAYYRLPFAWGDEQWVQGQGNLSTGPTHKNIYALDMVAPCDRRIRAARAGVVVMATESNDRQSWKDCTDDSDCPGHDCCPAGDSCGANVLLVRHQDDTFTRYIHFPEDGIVPGVGDVVRRGETVGFVGTTGNSSGPHLHFEAMTGDPTSALTTRLALFEAINAETHDVMTCYEPRDYPERGSVHFYLRSNNRPVP